EYSLPVSPWFRAVWPEQSDPGSTLSPQTLGTRALQESGNPGVISFGPGEESTLQLEWRFLGVLPVGRLKVERVSEVSVIPGGHAIGVLMNGPGLLVNHIAPVTDVHGRRRFPAEEAGIRPGDLIVEVNGRAASSPLEVARLVQEAGRRNQPLL